MSYAIAIIIGILGISFMFCYVANSLRSEGDKFLSIMKYLLYGMSLAFLLLIPANNYSIIDEANATMGEISSPSVFVDRNDTLLSSLMWSIIALLFLFMAWATWHMINNWKGGGRDYE